MLINKEIFRAYDIRGNATSDITPALAYKIGFFFATMNISSNRKICVGRDGRLSSPALYNALIEGLLDAGAEILNIGIVPTPVLYFADKQLVPAGSIMITASHNPKHDNGFKMIADGKPFFGEQIQKLLHQLSTTDYPTNPVQRLSMQDIDMTDDYIACILQDLNIDSKLKIAWDPGNGAACNIVRILQSKLQNSNVIINGVMDGNFPNHHPDPSKSENLQQLLMATREQNCDVGIAFDGDADRIGVVSKSGRILYGEQLAYLFAKEIIKHNSGAEIIVDVKTSQMIIDQIALCGGKPIIHRTGHTFIKAKMKETGALFAGEMSGHMFFTDRYYGYDDGIYAALRLIELLSNTSKSLDQLLSHLPTTYATPEIRITVPEQLKFKLIDQIKQQLTDNKIVFNDIDGVRVTTNTGWWLLRASNTESAIIAIAAAYSASGLAELTSFINELLMQYNLMLTAHL